MPRSSTIIIPIDPSFISLVLLSPISTTLPTRSHTFLTTHGILINFHFKSLEVILEVFIDLPHFEVHFLIVPMAIIRHQDFFLQTDFPSLHLPKLFFGSDVLIRDFHEFILKFGETSLFILLHLAVVILKLLFFILKSLKLVLAMS